MKPWVRQRAAALLRAGGTVACPTEAVWGLSCDPFNKAAVFNILSLKSRPVNKGLILVAGNARRFEALLSPLQLSQRQKIIQSWPGAVTWLVPHYNLVPEWVHGDSDKVAIRVTAHPELADLCLATGPLISTSANPAGKVAAKNELKVRCYFGNKVDYYLSGSTLGANSPSMIKDVLTGEVIRG